MLSNRNRLLNYKGPGTYPQISKLFKRFLKIITLAYIYQFVKFADFMSCDSKYIFKTATLFHVLILIMASQINGMVRNTKTWISWERKIRFLQNKKIINLYRKWHILISYRFSTEVTFKLIFLHNITRRLFLSEESLLPCPWNEIHTQCNITSNIITYILYLIYIYKWFKTHRLLKSHRRA